MKKRILPLLVSVHLVWVSILGYQGLEAQDMQRRLDRSIQDQTIVNTDTIASVESDVNELKASHLVERLTKLETTAEYNNKLLLGVLGACVLMLLERVFGIAKTKKEVAGE